MALHRKKELLMIREAFRHCALSGKVSKLALPRIFQKLEQEATPEMLESLPDAEMDFEVVVTIVDGCRQSWVYRQRKKAGYSEDELEKMEESFNKYDRDRSGEIDNFELQKLLTDYGWEPRTKEQVAALMRKLETARSLAAEAGVKELTAPNSAELKFWEFVQLARILQKEQDAAEVEKMKALKLELKFSPPEVEQFRQLFQKAGKEGNEQSESDEDNEALGQIYVTRDQVKRLLRKAGFKFNPNLAAEFDRKVTQLQDGATMVDFPIFLRLMRWMVDIDFNEKARDQEKN